MKNRNILRDKYKKYNNKINSLLFNYQKSVSG